MSADKLIYVCSKCDAQASKWSGRCFECGAWGTLETQNSKLKSQNEEKQAKVKKLTDVSSAGTVMTFEDLQGQELKRITADEPLAQAIFPQGLPLGSITLLGGEPGAGKSTLALQLSLQFTKNNKVIYFSSEESAIQIKEKVTRLGQPNNNFLFSAEHDTSVMSATVAKHEVQLIVVDSIQTINNPEMEAEPGSLNQLKASMVALMTIAKEQEVAIIVIGHVTKEGVVAGPKTLEHFVDIVYYLEGDPDSRYRLLRSTKNRYGTAGKVSVLQMTNGGLQVVKQAATAFISQYKPHVGSVITAVVDGGQVFFLEVQSLVTASNFGYAKRTASGLPVKRVEVLLAVMKKRLDLNFDTYDVYVNLVGGFKINDPAMDVAICLSLISSLKNKVASGQLVVFGEVGLAGELRPVKDTSLRLEAAQKNNFAKALLPKGNVKSLVGIDLIAVDSLTTAVQKLSW